MRAIKNVNLDVLNDCTNTDEMVRVPLHSHVFAYSSDSNARGLACFASTKDVDFFFSIVFLAFSCKLATRDRQILTHLTYFHFFTIWLFD